jgi:hypothetical protein
MKRAWFKADYGNPYRIHWTYSQTTALANLLTTNTNDSLKITRDRLLSRLMSGAFDVEKLDIAFPPSMEGEILAQGS